MSAPTDAPARSLTLPRGPILVATMYVLGVLIPLVIFLGIILFGTEDPHAPQGPIASIEGISGFGTGWLLIAAAVLYVTRTAQRAAAGAIVLGVLSVVTVVFFWCGAPGVLGASAAWRAGLTRGEQPLTGPARVAGLVGVFMAALNILLTFGGFLLALFGVTG